MTKLAEFDKSRLLARLGHVAVLLGGDSAEREVSLESGRAVHASLLRSGVQASMLDTQENALEQLSTMKPDFALNMLHGEGGEDGVIQGALELLSTPYSGSGVLASALAMDKIRAKQIWLQQGLATADFELLSHDTQWQAVSDRLGLCIVKPVTGGSSIGLAKAADAEQLEAAYAEASELGARVMAEACIMGPEYSVGVLDGYALPSIELETRGELFDFNAKYVSEETRTLCPANLTKSEAEELDALVLAAYHGLGCRGTARVDVMRHSDGKFYLLEINTLPGMTNHSFVPRAAAVLGIEFDELVLRIIDQGLAERSL
ncbi:D-alanine--D-alanine ligase [Gammaproteobacteria bacterium]|nr:D-alanine--D-alanine ligase [Gammaproteobacteria bacterium]